MLRPRLSSPWRMPSHGGCRLVSGGLPQINAVNEELRRQLDDEYGTASSTCICFGQLWQPLPGVVLRTFTMRTRATGVRISAK